MNPLTKIHFISLTTWALLYHAFGTAQLVPEIDTRFNAAGTVAGAPGSVELVLTGSFTASTNSEANGIALDPDQNIVLGGFAETFPDENDRFAAIKLSPAGQTIWSVILPALQSGSQDRANAVTVDSAGCVYLAGESDPFGNTNDQIAAVKLNPSGEVVWTAILDPLNPGDPDSANGVAVDASGCVYVGGGTVVPPGSQSDNFVAIKLSNTGAHIWTQILPRFSTNSTDEANAIAVTPAGVYLAGDSNPPGAPRDQIAAAQLSLTGLTLWTALLPYFGSGSIENNARGIAVDASGCSYLAGRAVNSSFDGQFAVVKLDNNGQTIWSAALPRLGSNVLERANGIALDNSGCLYLGGQATVSGSSFDSQFVAMKLTNTGVLIWVTAVNPFSSGSSDQANGIALNNSGLIYLGGTSDNGETTSSFAVASLNNDGTPLEQDAPSFTEPLNTAPLQFNGVAVDLSNNILLGGRVALGENLEQGFAASKLTNQGTIVWQTTLATRSSKSVDTARAIATDAAEAVYLGGDTLRANLVDQQFMAAKLDSAGITIWTAVLPTLSPESLDQANGIAVNTSETVFLAGSTEAATVQFAAASLDSFGALNWATALPSLQTSSDDEARALAIDTASSLYLGGFSELATQKFAIAKMSSLGVLTLTAIVPNFSVGSDDIAEAIAVDTDGSIYLAGTTRATAEQIAATKLDPSGSVVWQTVVPSLTVAETDAGKAMAIRDDALYIGGIAEDVSGADTMVAVKVSTDGDILWTAVLPLLEGSDNDTANGIALDSLGGIVLAGTSEGIVFDALPFGSALKLIEILQGLQPSPSFRLPFVALAAI